MTSKRVHEKDTACVIGAFVASIYVSSFHFISLSCFPYLHHDGSEFTNLPSCSGLKISDKCSGNYPPKQLSPLSRARWSSHQYRETACHVYMWWYLPGRWWKLPIQWSLTATLSGCLPSGCLWMCSCWTPRGWWWKHRRNLFTRCLRSWALSASRWARLRQSHDRFITGQGIKHGRVTVEARKYMHDNANTNQVLT